MPQAPATIIARNYDGTIRKQWGCRLVDRTDDLLVFVGEFSDEVLHPELGLIERGTVSYEYYWLGRWYNIFRFHHPSGELRNYYCNVNMPPTYVDGVLEYVDLDLDLLVWPDFQYKVLDRAEFAENALKNGWSGDIISTAEAALDTLVAFAESENFPPECVAPV